MTAAEPPRTTSGAPWSRPDALVDRTRWLFGLCVLASLLLTIGAAAPALARGGALPLAVASAAIAGSAVVRYRLGRAVVACDVVDVVALAAFTAPLGVPAAAFGLAFPMLWSRSVYGGGRGVALHATGVGAALLAATLAGPHLFGTAPVHAAAVAGTLPVMAVTVAVARHLASQLFGREQSRRRDGALATLGTQLLGLTDRDAVLRRAGEAWAAVCAATPGLRVVVLAGAGELLVPVGHAGPFRSDPPPLPRSSFPGDLAASPEYPVSPTAELTGAAGVRAAWSCLPMPGVPGTVVLMGAAPAVPSEGVVAARSLLNQVSLALRGAEAHEEVRTRALTDALTGLANRAAFTSALDAQRPSGGWALFVDLDDFKRVNDRLGHAAGDELLTEVAARLSAAVREGDLCARLGGDEFAVLMPDGDEADARALGQRLVEAVSRPVLLGEDTAWVGASVGAARLEPGGSPSATLRRADAAMYAAKAAGKNRVDVSSPAHDEVTVPA
ncbi:diguanylate cyclase domain-containing protein [Geodermatophilus nigrescens]